MQENMRILRDNGNKLYHEDEPHNLSSSNQSGFLLQLESFASHPADHQEENRNKHDSIFSQENDFEEVLRAPRRDYDNQQKRQLDYASLALEKEKTRQALKGINVKIEKKGEDKNRKDIINFQVLVRDRFNQTLFKKIIGVRNYGELPDRISHEIPIVSQFTKITSKHLYDCLNIPTKISFKKAYYVQMNEEGEYHGTLSSNKRLQGFGILYYFNNNVYRGGFYNGMRQNKGTLTWADGSEYDGMWVEDKMEGLGTYKWSDGREYKGMFKDNMMHGKGELKQKGGIVMRGTWDKGVVDSKAEFTVENNDKCIYTARVGSTSSAATWNQSKPTAFYSQSAR